MSKSWYHSRTLWANALSVIGAISLGAFGFEISAEITVIYFAAINVILRFVTNEGLEA